MGRWSTTGIDEIALSFSEIAGMGDEVLDEMLLAQGEIIKAEQQKQAKAMLQCPYYADGVAQGVSLGKVKRTSDGAEVYLTFKGTQHGNRLAEIAFVNEYGKEGQPARPFVKTANEAAGERAVAASEEIYHRYLQRKGL